jgi:hypothetical protein
VPASPACQPPCSPSVVVVTVRPSADVATVVVLEPSGEVMREIDSELPSGRWVMLVAVCWSGLSTGSWVSIHAPSGCRAIVQVATTRSPPRSPYGSRSQSTRVPVPSGRITRSWRVPSGMKTDECSVPSASWVGVTGWASGRGERYGRGEPGPCGAVSSPTVGVMPGTAWPGSSAPASGGVVQCAELGPEYPSNRGRFSALAKVSVVPSGRTITAYVVVPTSREPIHTGTTVRVPSGASVTATVPSTPGTPEP